tara:strand:- start:35 stop:562 length:528 start_codon:yes stop_codon:yes gene_type:complete
MKNKILIFTISIAFLLLFLVFFKGLKNPILYKPNIQLNSDLPEFETQDFFTEKIIFSKDLFSDKDVYLINIWSSWCLPCKEEHPYLLKFQNNTSAKLIGINYKDQKKNASQFLKQLRNPFDKIINDKDGTISINLGAYGVPETFLIKNNKIVKKVIGPINEKNYVEILKEINEKK